MTRRVVRRAQAVVPFGVGAVIDFPRDSLMAAGLDAWPTESRRGTRTGNQGTLYDERLAQRLGVTCFREPPARERADGQRGLSLPFVRFPLWHFCPRCRVLVRLSPQDDRPPRCSSTRPYRDKPACSQLPERKRPVVVPQRFVTVCENGHIEDFPWIEWAHSSTGQPIERGASCQDPLVHFYSTGRSGLVGLLVKCESCGSKRSMLGSASPQGLPGFECLGERPWLGTDGRDTVACDKALRVLQKGASNLHFSRVASSILIPPWSSRVQQLLDDPLVWETIIDSVDPDGVPSSQVVETVARMRHIDPEAMKEAVNRRLEKDRCSDTENESETEFRVPEYAALLSTLPDPDDLLAVCPQRLTEFAPYISDYFEDLVLVEKLAETRALVGFSRLHPPAAGPFEVDWERLALNKPDWLPAYRVFGEGIFLTFRSEKLQDWIARADQQLVDLKERASRANDRRTREVDPAFVMIHSFAHLLIRRLSFECGYGSSSLRERIYYAPSSSGHRPMNGLLIYTAAGDSEGTMGGLVRQGRPGRFEEVLAGALLEACWCASDPLCADSPGQGTDSLNLAACHACTLLPETSCEEGNRLLDRLSVVGTDQDQVRRQEGFFAPLVTELLEASSR